MSKANKRKLKQNSDKEEVSFEENIRGFKKNEIGEIKNIEHKNNKDRRNVDDNKIDNNAIEKNKKVAPNKEEQSNEELNNKIKAMEKKIKEMEKDKNNLEKGNKEKEKKIEEILDENKYLKSLLEDNKIVYNQKGSNEKQNVSKGNKIRNNNIDNNYNFNEENEKFLEKKLNDEQVFQSIQAYNKPTLVGLQNIGATCFMNSTLQCLSQTKRLTNYFLNNKNLNKIIKNNIAISNPKDYQLSPVYHELIQNLWKCGGQKYYAPNNFMNRVNDMNPLFKKGEAGDAKDFIIFILEQLHKELKKSLKSI